MSSSHQESEAHSDQKPARGLTVPLRVELELPPDAPDDARLAVYAYDENDDLIGRTHDLGSKAAALELPRQVGGRMITLAVATATADEGPSLTALRLREAYLVRILLDADHPAIDLGRLKLPPRWFKKSCCRVRGRVVRRIRLPNGEIIERPLCNARVVICEVDASPRLVIEELPDDLLWRLADELRGVGVELPIPLTEPANGLSDYRRVATRESRFAFAEDAAPGHRVPIFGHGGEHGTPGGHPEPGGNIRTEHPAAPDQQVHAAETGAHLVRQSRRAIEGTVRGVLLQHLDLVRLHWCRFPWLHRRYTLDCVKTVPLDSEGRFDTDIQYRCYGDKPDLYFRVEQGCGDCWETVYEPSVACTTRWNYCCGEEIEITVTGDVGLGPAIEARAHAYAPTDLASIGQWRTLTYDSQVFAVHAALLRTGKVLLFSGGVEHQLPLESRLWDPVTETFQAHSFADDLFCAFQVALGDGRILVMGGSNYNGPHGRGIDASYTFDPGSPGWTKHPDMAHGRWYPTAVTLPDGRVVAMSGRAAGGSVVAEAEIFDPGSNTWSALPASASKALDIYPSLHLMANGQVFYTGTRWEGGSTSPRPWSPPNTALFDPASNTWTDVGAHVIPNRTEGTSVLLPPRATARHHHGHGEEMPPPGTLSRVLVLGGDGGSLAERASAEVIDLDDPSPAWQRIADMHHRRVNPNAVILPDGNVAVCAGINGFKWDPDPGRVLETEIFDPQALTWQRAAVMSEGRQYHSVSILLPDGRVLNAGSVGGYGGSVNLLSMELFSPPYLFRGPRPKLTAYPASAALGSTVAVETPDACRIRRAALVRPGAPTHHTDSEQRYVPLDFHREGRCSLHLPLPSSAAVLPPGYYMLFLLDDCDVPSVGRFIRIHT